MGEGDGVQYPVLLVVAGCVLLSDLLFLAAGWEGHQPHVVFFTLATLVVLGVRWYLIRSRQGATSP